MPIKRGGPRPGAGRPKKAKKYKCKTASFSLSPGILRWISAESKRKGMTKSGYVEWALLSDRGQVMKFSRLYNAK